MSKILITGNGFDLFHHLPTKYGHFMAIMETIEELNFYVNVLFEDLFSKSFREKFFNDYDLIKKNYDTKNICFESQNIVEISELLKSNSWYKHFKSINEIETWIDFETEIENVLIDISNIFRNSRENPNIFNYYRKDKLNIYTDLSCFGFTQNETELEVKIKDSFLNFSNKKIKEKLILKELAISLETFKEIFSLYLSSIVFSFYECPKTKNALPIEKMSKIFTFNYTPTVEKFYKADDSKIVYLHGNVNKIILGISEIPEIVKENKFYHFTKYYQKIIKNLNSRFISLPEEKDDTRLETIFYIFGHSLDKSDEKYILDLFKFLELDLNRNSKICVFYINEDDHEKKLNNILSIVNNEFVDKMNKDQRFYFVELTETSILTEFSRPLTRLGDGYRYQTAIKVDK